MWASADWPGLWAVTVWTRQAYGRRPRTVPVALGWAGLGWVLLDLACCDLWAGISNRGRDAAQGCGGATVWVAAEGRGVPWPGSGQGGSSVAVACVPTAPRRWGVPSTGLPLGARKAPCRCCRCGAQFWGVGLCDGSASLATASPRRLLCGDALPSDPLPATCTPHAAQWLAFLTPQELLWPRLPCVRVCGEVPELGAAQTVYLWPAGVPGAHSAGVPRAHVLLPQSDCR